MDERTLAALEALSELHEDELLDYLTDMVLLAPEVFLTVGHTNYMMMIQEMREETHNGHPMYPELQL